MESVSKKCEELYEAYNFKILNKRPYTSIKLATILDGKIATKNYESKWITNEESRKRVHDIRGINDSIVTELITILQDYPNMTSRYKKIYR